MEIFLFVHAKSNKIQIDWVVSQGQFIYFQKISKGRHSSEQISAAKSKHMWKHSNSDLLINYCVMKQICNWTFTIISIFCGWLKYGRIFYLILCIKTLLWFVANFPEKNKNCPFSSKNWLRVFYSLHIAFISEWFVLYSRCSGSLIKIDNLFRPKNSHANFVECIMPTNCEHTTISVAY